jgi:predicted molibdopterin-dependent oxidoreductase YjgC
MLKRYRNSQGKTVTIWFEEKPISAQEGESVAAALLNAGVEYLRTAPVSGDSRTAYCWMGVCFDCLLEIDGQPNRQSCLIPVQEGMKIRRHALNDGDSA